MAKHPIAVALDLTDAVAFRAEGRACEALSCRIPCALLPLHEREPPLAGVATETHRRGSGLEWPPEAQVPVLGENERGTGRIPLAAAWAKLVREERGGILGDTAFHWSPDPASESRRSMEAATLIATAVKAWAGKPAVLTVPDGLGPAGQQALLDALGREDPHLMPASVAAALAWCRDLAPDALLKGASEGDGKPAGHLWVLHAGIGIWSLSLIHLRAVAAKDKTFLTPVFSRQQAWPNLGISGATLLGSPAVACAAMVQEWPSSRPIAERPELFLPTLDGWHPLACEISPVLLNGRLRLLQQTCRETEGVCRGLLIHGAFRNEAAHLLHGSLAPAIVLPESAVARGGAETGKNLPLGLPSWKEKLDPLDIYYSGTDELGDPCIAWKPLIAAATVDAGRDYAPPPIAGLEIPAGADRLGLVLRMGGEGKPEYRGIEARLERPQERESPVLLDVRIRPGGGFARVEVRSKESGLFNSRLDWRHLSVVDAPMPPKLGYIPRSVVIRADPILWRAAEPALREFLVASTHDISRKNLLVAIRSKWSRWPKDPHASDDPYAFIAAIGSDGKPPSGAAYDLWRDTREKSLELWKSHDLEPRQQDLLRRMMAWSYAGCPAPMRTQAEAALKASQAAALDLHIAGLCFRSDASLRLFWKSLAPLADNGMATNEWLRACRNITRLNEHALSPTVLDADTAETIAHGLFQLFETSVAQGKSTTAGNALESLMFLLKRRRYQPNFMDTTCPVRQTLETRIRHPMPFLSRRLQAMREPFLNLLRCEADAKDIAALMLSETEEE